LNEAAVSPSKCSFPLPENPWANEFECTTSHTHQYCNDYPDHTIDYETAESPSRGSFLLPPLKKTHHENPWASEFDCTISHTHQYCNDYPDLTIDYPYHSLDDDTSEIQGAAAETSDTDAIRQILTVNNRRQPIPGAPPNQVPTAKRTIFNPLKRVATAPTSNPGVETHPAAKQYP